MRVLIVDDEPLARESARLALVSDPDVTVVGACTGVDAAGLVRTLAPDLLLLDVQMPEVDGFAVVDAIGPAALPGIIFVTAYDQYAVRAFEIHAIDYVLKPFDDRRLLAALDRAKQRTRTYVSRFFVREREKTVIVEARDVDSLQAADDYVELHAGATVHLVRERLAELEHRLDPAMFVRIHRSAIVNLTRVREIQPLIRGDAMVTLAGGTALRCSRSRRADLERRLAAR
jgi:two-component system LytT family response regulator